jgi:hypothetical protein
MLSRGFHRGPTEAIAAIEAEQVEFAKLAAEREYDMKHRLSARAKAEVLAAEDAHGTEHLPAVPETNIRRMVPASEATLNQQKKDQANARAKQQVDQDF